MPVSTVPQASLPAITPLAPTVLVPLSPPSCDEVKPTDYDEVFTDGPDKKAETKAEASEEENLNEEDADKASPVQPVSEV